MATTEQVYARACLSVGFAVTSVELRFLATDVANAAERILRDARSVTAKENFARKVERLIQACPEYQAEEHLAEQGLTPDSIVPHLRELLRLCREE
jgi:hypothetical protein